jgi:hypothetical protein
VKRLAKWLGIAVAAYVVLALALDAYVAATQPEFSSEGVESVVLHSFDSDGTRHTTALAGFDDQGQLWVQSGHHFRGWYHRIKENPQVEVARNGGEPSPYTATPVETPEAEQHLIDLIKQRTGNIGHYGTRALLLFADIRPVKLDPVTAR